MRQLIGKRQAVFHRAFDVTPNPFKALEQLVDLGITRVLTSGQKDTVPEGVELIAELMERAGKRIEILPGGGGLRPFEYARDCEADGLCSGTHDGVECGERFVDAGAFGSNVWRGAASAGRSLRHDGCEVGAGDCEEVAGVEGLRMPPGFQGTATGVSGKRNWVARRLSFAPPRLEHLLVLTHGLRRGLYSCAAPRLYWRSG